MSTNSVLVTGATGFIGRHCLPVLLGRGWRIHAVTRALCEGLPTGVAWHECDLLDQNASRSLIEKTNPTHVLHIAWSAEHGAFWMDPTNLDWVGATLNLLRECHRVGVRRVVGIGTCAEYGVGQEICYDTKSDYRPTGVYARCKYATHLGFDAARESLGLSTAWAMLFFPYGPYDSPNRLIPYAVRQLLAGEFAEFSAGDQIRDPLHVEDVASAITALLESEINGAVNICSGRATRIREIIEIISEAIGRSDLVRLGSRDRRSEDASRWVGSTTRLTEELQWQSSLSLESGLKETIRWHSRLREDMDRDRY